MRVAMMKWEAVISSIHNHRSNIGISITGRSIHQTPIPLLWLGEARNPIDSPPGTLFCRALAKEHRIIYLRRSDPVKYFV
jgi:hypothetical protein